MCFLRCSRLVVLLLGVAGPGPVRAQQDDRLTAPPNAEGPIEVQIGFQLFDIADIDELEETVDFEGGVYLMWMDSRLAYDPAEVGLAEDAWAPGDYSKPPRRLYQDDYAVKEVFPGWRPRINLSNGVEDRQWTYVAVGVWPDGMVLYAERFHCTAETKMNLRRYPFDRQSVRFYLHPFLYERSDVLLIPAAELAGTWNRDQGIAGWSKKGVTLEERATRYSLMEGVKTFSELIVTVDIARVPEHLLLSIIVPLLILVSLTWCIFWLDEQSVTERINISFIGILSVVAYYFVILDGVPQVPYLTMMDAFMIATFLILAATVAVSIVVEKLNRSGRVRIGDRVDRVARWSFPLGYTAVVTLIMLVFFTMD